MRFMSMIRIEENTGHAPSEQLMNETGKLFEGRRRAVGVLRGVGYREPRRFMPRRWVRLQASATQSQLTACATAQAVFVWKGGVCQKR
jgi:hypothetical protein